MDIKVILTPDECEALEDYLWISLIPFVQDKNNEVDNLMYLKLLTEIWEKCKLFNDAMKGRAMTDDLIRRQDALGAALKC